MVFFQEIYIIQSQWLYQHMQGTMWVVCLMSMNLSTVFPRVVPAGTIDFTYWIDAASIRGRPLFEGGFYFFRSHGRERWKFRVLKEATTYTSVYGLL